MAVLQSCCRCLSLRRGSFVCGIYSLVYFVVFSYLSGPNVVYETILRFDGESWKRWISLQGNQSTNKSDVDDATTLITGFTLSIIQPIADDPDDESFGNPIVYVLSVVDFISESLGFIFSMLLLIGLFMDRLGFLVPWLIVVPLHTVIDTFMVIFIIIDHVEEKGDDPWEVAMRNIPLFLLDVTLNMLNIYMFLCVLSQYQEYRIGRGTQSYEAYTRRQYKNEVRGLRLISGLTTTNRSSSGATNQIRSGRKSEVWLEDLMLEKLDASIGGNCADNSSLAARLKRNADKSSAKYGASSSRTGRSVEGEKRLDSGIISDMSTNTVPTTINCSEISKKFLLPEPSHSNPRSSPSLRSTYSSIGMEDSTVETFEF